LGGNPEENAREILDLLNGKKGPFRDIVTFNASVGLIATGNALNLTEAKKRVEKSLLDGFALEKLNELIEVSNN
jgi:anthranilate phosphoribosyltransferase